MKLKGISLVERHFEKGLVLIGVLLIGGVGAWQFIYSDTTFEMDGTSGGVPIAEIDEKLKERAERIQRGQAENAPSKVTFPEATAQLTAEFAARLASSAALAGDLPPNGPSLAAAITPTGSTADTWYYEPNYGPVLMSGVVQTQDAIDPKELEGRPGLSARFATGGPYDIQWATPFAMLNMSEVRAQITRADQAANPPRAAVPEPWYGASLAIADVVFERQELQPSGSWADPITVEPLEGASTFRNSVDGADAAVREEMLDELASAARQWEVLQPHFFATPRERFEAPIPGAAPTAAVAETPERRQARELSRRLSRKRSDLAKVEDALRKAGGELDPSKEPKKDPRGGGSGGGGSGGGGGGGGRGGGGGFGGGGDGGGDGGGGSMGGRNTGPDGNDEAARAKRIGLTRRRNDLAGVVRDLESRLAALPAAAGPASVDTSARSAWESDQIVVWAHDPEVVPGATYRYRATVRFYNPFFTRAPMLVSEQSKLADMLITASATSEWGEPVRIDEPLSFFVTRAVASDGKSAAAKATIEIFRLINGERRKLTVTAEPGDSVGKSAPPDRIGTAATASGDVDFDTGWFILDIVQDPTRDTKPGDSATPAFVLVQKIGSDDPAVTMQLHLPWVDADDSLRKQFLAECEDVAVAAPSASPDGTDPNLPPSRSRLGGS